MRVIDEHNDNWKVVRDWALNRLHEITGAPDHSGVWERPAKAWEEVVALRAEARALRKLLGLPKELKHGRTSVEPT